MYRIFLSLTAAIAVAAADEGSSTCTQATGEECLSGSQQTASHSDGYAHDVVLMQMTHAYTRTPLPKVTWSESDPLLDEDFPEDDQPGGQDLTRTPVVASNASAVQVAQVQASVSQPADPAADDEAASAVSVATDDEAASASSNVSDNETVNASNATNASGNSTEDSANAISDVGNTTGGCATRADDRIRSWFAATAAPGSACIFGVDVRDENSHCIFENGAYGSNGWCFTASDRSEWGACNEHCPLYGPPSSLGKKIDTVAKKLDKVAAKLMPEDAKNETEEKPAPEKPAEDTGNTTAKEPITGNNDNADASAGAEKGKGKGKGTEVDAAKGKGKGKGKEKA